MCFPPIIVKFINLGTARKREQGDRSGGNHGESLTS